MFRNILLSSNVILIATVNTFSGNICIYNDRRVAVYNDIRIAVYNVGISLHDFYRVLIQLGLNSIYWKTRSDWPDKNSLTHFISLNLTSNKNLKIMSNKFLLINNLKTITRTQLIDLITITDLSHTLRNTQSKSI